MTEEQKAAYIYAMATVALAEIAGMQAENQQRECQGDAPAYREDDFAAVVQRNGVHHNAVLTLFQG